MSRTHSRLPTSEAEAEEEDEGNALVSGASQSTSSSSAAPPRRSQPQWTAADATSASLPADPTMIKIEFHRAQLSRFLLIATLIGASMALFTPIIALIFAPAGALALYWLRDSVRFQHGGDPQRCSNRDCSLTYVFITGMSAALVSGIAIFLLAAGVFGWGGSSAATESVVTGDNTNVKTGSSSVSSVHNAGSPEASSTFHVVALLVHFVFLPLMIVTLHHLVKLRRLLSGPIGSTAWHNGSNYNEEDDDQGDDEGVV